MTDTNPTPGSASLRVALLVLIVAVFALDQWTKELARQRLPHSPRHFHAGPFQASLIYAENEGAFLSLGSTLAPAVRTFVFTGAVAVAVGVALFVLFTGGVHGADAVAIALIAAGGIGNLVDRVVQHGRVTDFLYLEFGFLRTGVFNVADMGITGGVIWLLISSFFPRKKEAPSDQTAAG